jgi:hypothetical protein
LKYEIPIVPILFLFTGWIELVSMLNDAFVKLFDFAIHKEWLYRAFQGDSGRAIYKELL